MDKPRIRVDFNERVQPDVMLLSKTDLTVNSAGIGVLLTEGLPVFVYEYNHCPDATEEYSLADGTAELNEIASMVIGARQRNGVAASMNMVC